MKRLVLIPLALLAVTAAGCKKPPPAPPPPPAVPADPEPTEATRQLFWKAHSTSGSEAKQVARAPDDCTVTCKPQGGAGWTRQGCLATKTDFRFVPDDCAQLVVLYEYPEFQGQKSDAIVGVVVAPDDEPVPLRLYKFMQSTADLKINGSHLMWLAGALGVAGTPPALKADGSGIDFATIDQVPHSPTFQALGVWVDTGPAVQAPEPAPVAAKPPAHRAKPSRSKSKK